MQIPQKTIDHFAQKGVSVRWYPEATYEEYKQAQWNNEFKRWFDHDKCFCKELNPMGEWVSSWTFETKKELEEHIAKFCDRIIARHCRPYESTKLFIEYDGKMIVHKENTKSKEITIEYIQKLIDKNEKAYKGRYGEFALNMQKLLKSLGIDKRMSIYPTTYGIGVWVLYNMSADTDIAVLKYLLKKRGIKHTSEYSDAAWVYRFKISKEKENLEKAKLIENGKG